MPLGLLVAPAGLDPLRVDEKTREWVFNVEVNTNSSDIRTGKQERVDSVEFAAEEGSVAFFAAGWFSYAAFACSAGRFSREQFLRMLKGAGLQTGLNVVSLCAWVYINAYGAAINSPGGSGLRLWLVQYYYHIIYLVIPFVGPFVVAMLIHPEWRGYAGFPGPKR